MNVYVASSWRNDYQQTVVEMLRINGNRVYDFRNPPGRAGFGWEKIHEDWAFWSFEQYKQALLHPLAEEGFASDFEAMKSADVCVLVLPCGRSAHSEAGWMKGAGKKVFVLQVAEQEPELMYKMYDGIFNDLSDIIRLCK